MLLTEHSSRVEQVKSTFDHTAFLMFPTIGVKVHMTQWLQHATASLGKLQCQYSFHV